MKNKTKFLLSFFDKDSGYCEKEVNGFWLIKIGNSRTNNWIVQIFSDESYRKYKGHIIGVDVSKKEIGKLQREGSRFLKKQRKTGKKRYEEYINSQEWKDRCDMFYRTREKICAACGSVQNIHLHHMTYARLGNELDADLIPLCANCHKEYHEKNGVQKEMLEKTIAFVNKKLGY